MELYHSRSYARKAQHVLRNADSAYRKGHPYQALQILRSAYDNLIRRLPDPPVALPCDTLSSSSVPWFRCASRALWNINDSEQPRLVRLPSAPCLSNYPSLSGRATFTR